MKCGQPKNLEKTDRLECLFNSVDMFVLPATRPPYPAVRPGEPVNPRLGAKWFWGDKTLTRHPTNPLPASHQARPAPAMFPAEAEPRIPILWALAASCSFCLLCLAWAACPVSEKSLRNSGNARVSACWKRVRRPYLCRGESVELNAAQSLGLMFVRHRGRLMSVVGMSTLFTRVHVYRVVLRLFSVLNRMFHATGSLGPPLVTLVLVSGRQWNFIMNVIHDSYFYRICSSLSF